VTKIEWTDAVWNPMRGCSRVSEGCMHCYAERMAARFSGPGKPYRGLILDGRWTGQVRFLPEKLDLPLRWRRPRRVFVNSMSDLFHGWLSNERIAAVFGVMAAAPKHTFQVLTKRPGIMHSWFQWAEAQEGGALLTCDELAAGEIGACHMGLSDEPPWPLPNVHIGVSVEDQIAADRRIPLLLETPAAVRFVSAEPLLDPLDLASVLDRCSYYCDHDDEGGGHRRERTLDWVIVGAESGPGARRCGPHWIRSIVQQCREADVPVFVKQVQVYRCPLCGNCWEQHPEWPAEECDSCHTRARRVLSKDPDEWPDDLRIRQFPVPATTAAAP